MKTKTTTFLLLFLLSSLFVNSAFSQNYWEESFIDSVYTSEVKENSAGHLFCSTFNGVYQSKDLGKTWTNIGLAGISLHSIEINPVNNHIYVGSQRFVYCSTDDGATWQKNDFDFFDNVTVLYFSQNNDFFAGSWGAMYKSSDGGNSWKKVYTCDNTMNVASIIDAGNGILLAGITGWMGGGGVFRSDDYGEEWEYIGMDGAYIRTLQINTLGDLYAGSIGNYHTYESGIYKSSDLGQTWEMRNYIQAMSLVIDAENTLYATTNYVSGPGGMYRSIDEGATWQRIASGMSDPRVYYIALSRLGYLYAYGNYSGIFYKSVLPVATGMENSSEDFSIKPFPNPFSDVLYVDGITANDASLTVSDMTGRVVFHNQYSGDAIHLSHLLPGVYTLYVKVGNKQTVHKIVKK